VLDIGQPSDDTVTAAKINNDVISGQTALTSAPDDTDELLISDAGTIKRIDVSLVGGKNTPAFYAYQHEGTAVELSTGTFTKLVFGTEVFDTDSKYDTSAGRFTPATAGKYFVFGAVAFSTGTDFSQNECAIYKNGSQEVINISDNDSYSASYVTGIIDMDADDYVEIYAKHNLGSSVYTLPDNAGKYVRFGAYKLIT